MNAGAFNLAQWIASGRLVDLILVFMLIEVFALMVYRARSNRGMALLDIVLALVPGAFLLLALRAALIGLPWFWIALALTAALPSHLLDIARRSQIRS
jgi:hypothetical protein